MCGYLAASTRLGWLIDPQSQRVEIYRRDRAAETPEQPKQLAGKDGLPGFTSNLQSILLEVRDRHYPSPRRH